MYRSSSFVSYCYAQPAGGSVFFPLYFIGAYLAPLRPEWLFLRDNSSPSAGHPTPFYGKCLNFLSTLDNLPLRNSLLSTKQIYCHFLKKTSSPPILPYTWSAILGPGFVMKDHWTRVRDPLTENFKSDLLWFITLRGVKVRDSLKNWGYIASDQCAVCNRKETIDHCFLNCVRVKRVWSYFTPPLSSLLRSPFRPYVPSVFSFRWSSNHRKKNAIAVFLIKSILYAIWIFRNRATFHNGRTHIERSLDMYSLMYRIESNLTIFVCPLPTFALCGNFLVFVLLKMTLLKSFFLKF